MKRTRLRPMSAKRAVLAKEYAMLRKAFLAARPKCEKCKTKKAQDVHHVHGRLAGAYLNTATWKALCRGCHDWIHSHPGEARRTGWLK